MSLIKESEGIYCDFSRQRVSQKTIEVRKTLPGGPEGSCVGKLHQCSGQPWA